MRSVIYGAIITAFLASAGTVHAGKLEGVSLYCPGNVPETTMGFIFGKPYPQAPDIGKLRLLRVTKDGISDDDAGYRLNGVHHIDILFGTYRLDRRDLVLTTVALEKLPSWMSGAKCQLASIQEVNRWLKDTLIRSKKKNKI
jgi:hypothetical protein